MNRYEVSLHIWEDATDPVQAARNFMYDVETSEQGFFIGVLNITTGEEFTVDSKDWELLEK